MPEEHNLVNPFPLAATEAETELRRELNLLDCITLVVGSVIGSGIFLVPQSVARHLPESGLIFGVWLFSGLFALWGGLSYAELGASMPNTGGAYLYIREAYGKFWAFLYGWITFWVVNTGSIATLASAFGIYMSHIIPINPLTQKLFSIGAILFLTYINYRGIRSGATTQNITTFIKVGGLALLILGGIFFSQKQWSNFQPFWPDHFSFSILSNFGLAMVGTLWAFEGWHMMPMAGGEIRSPRRNIPMGMITGLLMLVALYFLANFSYLTQLSIPDMANSPFVAADSAKQIAGQAGALVISLVILISVIGAANSNLMATTRVFFSMAKDGVFFQKVTTVHPVYHSPSFSIILQGIWACLLTLMVGTFEDLFTFTISASAIFYGVTVGAVFILRKKYPDMNRPYKVWGYPITPALFIIVVTAFVINTTINTLSTQPQNIGIFLLILGAGLFAYRHWTKNT